MVKSDVTRRIEGMEQDMVDWRTRLDEKAGLLGGQITQLCADMVEEFSAVREEMATGFAAVREEMATGLAAVREEMAAEFTAVRREIAAGDEETRRYMRVLHEEVLDRLSRLGER